MRFVSLSHVNTVNAGEVLDRSFYYELATCHI
ncbi:hypothetical protein CO2235_MP10391 [Cupriavidus oxalaticus]|uniref:Uncharacterized protein n=1 Tax=Cupriavidus oxalaticus TaxID=96344 RepID=A0A375FFZ7_9BURK|nr:hypothetical protein CO2235_U1010041 [Cupriavidus oxalaticus]SPC18217.1 hypothetical protein CO2235_MP10391 [Cupriavidus oxalaticus]